MSQHTDDVHVVPERRLRFDGTINAGHILSILAFLLSGLAAWSNLDKRVVVLEEARKVQLDRDAAQDANLKDRLEMLQRGVDGLQRGIDKLAERMDKR